ncbi:MAG TPA: stage II sporulation protein M [Thermoanaerobaculia bacterium]|nr:stage II sporulation protein M [Thermoanaerobaculia bacterium]
MLRLKSAQFRRERESVWRELEILVERVEKSGLASLSADELNRLPTLYRSAVGSLSVAQAISLDRNLLDYLTSLVARTYICVYGTKRRAGDAVAEFLLVRFPQAVRRHLLAFAAAVAVLALGTLAGFQLTLADPERFYSFVDEDLAGGRNPGASTEDLRAALYDDGDGPAGILTAFAAFLFTHNARVGFLCFALGFAAGVPVLFLLFSNGLMLGAFAALYHSHGLSMELWAWLLPHGVTELGAVCLCGAAGLALGNAVVFPGPYTRLRNLALRGRDAALLAIGSVVLFFVAGLIEGLFRQLVHDVGVRWLVVALTSIFWTWYFLSVGKGRDVSGAL